MAIDHLRSNGRVEVEPLACITGDCQLKRHTEHTESSWRPFACAIYYLNDVDFKKAPKWDPMDGGRP